MSRPPAPAYVGEGPHALWHYSEDPSIREFQPHVAATAQEPEAWVWAVDTRHAPLFWFPRDCPRGCAWATEETTAEDMDRFFAHTEARRIHVIEAAWLEAMRTCRLYAYELPAEPFVSHPEVGGYWVSEETVRPLEVMEVGDLLERHAASGIELRVAPSIWPWWSEVVGSSLGFSGCRLRNCTVPMPTWAG